jgi:uncharacterized protein (DUF983 family)
MMRSRKLSFTLHKFRVGLALRCPSCERGRLFEQGYRMNKVCPYCASRFERSSGDSIGGVYINVALAEITALGGYFLTEALFHPPALLQLAFWIMYIVVFALVFYRHARGAWAVVSLLTGGVYPDMDVDHQYISEEAISMGHTPGKTTREHE